MKIPFKQIEGFVKQPNTAARAILVYGPDSGLMQERAKTMALTVVSDINDPFNAVTLSADQIAEDPARLSDEASAMSMMGGARLIRITDAADKLTVPLKDYLQSPSSENLVIIEAGELSPRSSLRQLCEKSDNAAALPCYVEDERNLSSFIRETLQAEGYRPAPDAVTFLSGALIGDRMRARREVEKLIIYLGPDQKEVSLNDVIASCGSAGEKSLDDLVYAVGSSQGEKAQIAYRQLIDEGVPVIAVLRALQNHFRRLHQAKAFVASGKTPDEAMKSLSPEVFFKQKDAFRAQMQNYSVAMLEKTFTRLAELEAQCKKTETPVETLCGQALLSLSQRKRAA